MGYLAHQLKGLIPSTIIPRKTPSQWEAEILGRHSLLTPEARAHPMVRPLQHATRGVVCVCVSRAALVLHL